MAAYRVLAEAFADDVLADWRWYCQRRQMTFGGFPGEGSHTFTIVAEEHRMQVTIGSAEGSTPEETLTLFLREYVRRHPHLTVTEHNSEQELLESTKFEGSVGFIIA